MRSLIDPHRMNMITEDAGLVVNYTPVSNLIESHYICYLTFSPFLETKKKASLKTC